MADPKQKQVKKQVNKSAKPTAKKPTKAPAKKTAKKKPVSPQTQAKLNKMSPQKQKEYLKRKKQVERNRKILGIFLLTIVAAVLILLLLFKVFFKIENITVTGKSPYEASQVINACGVSKGDSLLACKEEKITEGIKKNLPYITSVKVKKKLPSTLTIEATATEAFLAVDTTSGTAITDKNGKVLEFASADKFKGKIAKLEAGTSFDAEIGEKIFETATGKDAKKAQIEKAEMLKTIFEACKASKIKGLTSINIKSSNNIYMMYQNRLKLNLGTISDIEYKLKAAREIIEKENQAAPSEKAEIFLADTKNIYVSPEGN
ncbi:MAG: FtsQ-type POTRA domain-containing protein [Clostridia bacterium]|nr:FtsQ-type POTRA domain-containing protein [Clostridia bacterium]